ncbi:energy-coupling factor transporter transmembrane component T [Sinimarinibacterium sp. CAU 1509]|uniref:energy-coupling factor transporter transmembrane component T n=1 Tax=Sinimarinibacterium sp. CAU 1509 TaxID=2562283 RepID=UPI00146C469C|nr:energy-coupling factor transporter transmembrane component T [Sinimarinibacterium sp. CAU 1509]
MRVSIHPAVRVLIVLVLAAFSSQASLAALGVWALLLLSSYFLAVGHDTAAVARLRNGVSRLRWLLLAIFVLYAGFTPGTPIVTTLPGISREGLLEGLRRALVLIDLLMMVYLLLALTPVNELVAAIHTLVRPLRPLGVDPQRLGLRLALALDQVNHMHTRLRGEARAPGNWAQRAADLISEIEHDAQHSQRQWTLTPVAEARWWEWLLPLAILALLMRWTP